MTKPLRILLAEDEAAIRAAYAELLRLRGHEVSTAEDGQAAVATAESWQPNVILMDIRMPVMNGLEAIRRLRQNPKTAKILIYALTSYTDAKTCAEVEEAGADGIFAKPPDLKLIDDTVEGDLLMKMVIS
jgi:CheY-like chemotaxis protein